VPKPVLEKLAGIPAPSTTLNATDTMWQFFAQNHH
jgi:polyhydroxybutyrate depolymerase